MLGTDWRPSKDLKPIAPVQCCDAAIEDGTNTIFMVFGGELNVDEETVAFVTVCRQRTRTREKDQASRVSKMRGNPGAFWQWVLGRPRTTEIDSMASAVHRPARPQVGRLWAYQVHGSRSMDPLGPLAPASSMAT
ncbi:conserved hypothetical protein [Histoplasma capsulatum H143]|uniref:Uncharacterized protein n=1 Tax=Ajellomyces capsulatus (strain H143) TaxID=544712 RepID=C6HDU8_AJECH|nr:conserved hypothetical protein [Histoplasma capsulatum H143]